MPLTLENWIIVVVLDINNTLIYPSTEQKPVEAIADRFLSNHLEEIRQRMDELAQAFELGLISEADRMKKIIETIIGSTPRKPLIDDLIAIERAACLEPMKFYAGVEETFSELKSLNLTPILCSNGTKIGRYIAEQMGLIKLAGGRAIFSFEVEEQKPHPKMYQKVAGAMGVAPEMCLFVDDEPSSVEGARAAGMVTVHCDQNSGRSSDNPGEPCPSADFTIYHIGDLINLIRTGAYPVRLI